MNVLLLGSPPHHSMRFFLETVCEPLCLSLSWASVLENLIAHTRTMVHHHLDLSTGELDDAVTSWKNINE